jgi:dihydroorotate dehydrogenase
MIPGFDTNGEATGSLLNLGFSFIEIGSISPKKHQDNKNNNDSINSTSTTISTANAATRNIQRNLSIYNNSRSFFRNGNIGINICSNMMRSNSDMLINDYVKVIQYLGCDADYLVININDILVNFSTINDTSNTISNTKTINSNISQKELLYKLLVSAKEARDNVMQKRQRQREVITC